VKAMRLGPRLEVLVAFVLGIALGAIITWAVVSSSGARVHIVEGHVSSVNVDGTAIGIAENNEGYIIAGARWRVGNGPWNETFPTCLEPLTSGQKVRLGVVNATAVDNAPGGTVVVWLECLD
jgi:hypothetical protein